MKKYITLIIAVLITAMGAMAQDNASKSDKAERARWFKKISEYKHEFIAKELNLTKEQQNKFFPLYDEMETATRRLDHDTRALERKVRASGDKTTDIEYEKAAEAMFELKAKEGAVEQSYLKKFKTVLTPEQLFKLKIAERKFTKQVMHHHSKAKATSRDKK
ncbi:MAG: Spy/CpxP family protein refolding chaperone [Pseudoflavonifractor sp.]|nr:Spy/CpxP family protein refolding chaperone [Pseudoflavonifractor sp.]